MKLKIKKLKQIFFYGFTISHGFGCASALACGNGAYSECVNQGAKDKERYCNIADTNPGEIAAARAINGSCPSEIGALREDYARARETLASSKQLQEDRPWHKYLIELKNTNESMLGDLKILRTLVYFDAPGLFNAGTVLLQDTLE